MQQYVILLHSLVNQLHCEASVPLIIEVQLAALSVCPHFVVQAVLPFVDKSQLHQGKYQFVSPLLLSPSAV